MVTKGCDYTWAKLSGSPLATTPIVDQSGPGHPLSSEPEPNRASLADFEAILKKVSEGDPHDQQEFVRKWNHAKVQWDGYVSTVLLDGEGVVSAIEIAPQMGEEPHRGIATAIFRSHVAPGLLSIFDAVRKGDKVRVEGNLEKPLRPELVLSRIDRTN